MQGELAKQQHVEKKTQGYQWPEANTSQVHDKAIKEKKKKKKKKNKTPKEYWAV